MPILTKGVKRPGMLCTNQNSLGRVEMSITPQIKIPDRIDGQAGLIAQLQDNIRQVETASRVDDGSLVKNGCAAIDYLLPEKGYPRGTLVQWITAGGSGADFLSLRVAQKACEDGGALVVIDPLNQFFPPAAAAIGINLDNLIVLRTGPQSPRSAGRATTPTTETGKATASYQDLLWAVDQSLRCPAVAAVWGPLEINERWFRRFQLSAESSGCLGLFLQPPGAAKQPSWADVQWLVGMSKPSHPDNLPQHSQLVRLQLTRCRGTHTGKTINVAINHITGNVQPARRDHEQHQFINQRLPKTKPATGKHPTNPLPMATQLAHPATGRQRA